MISEAVILSLLLSGALLLLGLRYRSLPVVLISSLGWMISGLQVYQELAAPLPMLLLIMLAIAQYVLAAQKTKV